MKQDQSLAIRALREGWPITPEKRQELMDMVFELATNKDAKPRDRLRAMKVVLEADKVNVVREKNDQDRAAQEEHRQAVIFIKDKDGESAAIAALQGRHESRTSRSMLPAPPPDDGPRRDSAG